MDASIIIPTHNRKEALLETLQALEKLDHPGDRWEAIVVDDGSTDGTEAAVSAFIESSGSRVRFMRQENAGPAAARNRGAAAARGRALIFIDNDIVVRPDFLRRHLETLAAHPGCWVVGRIVNSPEMRGTPFGRYRDEIWEEFHDSLPHDGVSEIGSLSAANVSLPAEDFRRLGGFDESFTIASSEDWDLGARALGGGVRILYDPEIVVTHNDWAGSLDKFCERHRLYSVSDVLLWSKYGEGSPRARLVRENMPVDWGGDSARVVAKKIAKRVLSCRLSERSVRAACRVVERLLPDSAWSRRAYRLAISVAIFRGVREGLSRYGEGRYSETSAAAPARAPNAR